MIEQIKHLRVEIDKHIQRADLYKHNSERLRFAKSWLGKLLGELGEPNPYLTGQGMTDLADKVNYHVEFDKDAMLDEINEIEKTLQKIINFAPEFERQLEEHNQPIWKQIQELQRLGDKTIEDQKELFSKIIILTYPCLQLACQYLQEAKFQYNYKINDITNVGG